MAVTITDIRNVTGLSVDEIADARITAFIADATLWCDNAGITATDGSNGENACKYRASYLSYTMSNTYLQASAGPINVREPFEYRARIMLERSRVYERIARGKGAVITKKIPLLRERTVSEQEKKMDEVDLVV